MSDGRLTHSQKNAFLARLYRLAIDPDLADLLHDIIRSLPSVEDSDDPLNSMLTRPGGYVALNQKKAEL